MRKSLNPREIASLGNRVELEGSFPQPFRSICRVTQASAERWVRPSLQSSVYSDESRESSEFPFPACPAERRPRGRGGTRDADTARAQRGHNRSHRGGE
jgi:hypothetical protein